MFSTLTEQTKGKVCDDYATIWIKKQVLNERVQLLYMFVSHLKLARFF